MSPKKEKLEKTNIDAKYVKSSVILVDPNLNLGETYCKMKNANSMPDLDATDDEPQCIVMLDSHDLNPSTFYRHTNSRDMKQSEHVFRKYQLPVDTSTSKQNSGDPSQTSKIEDSRFIMTPPRALDYRKNNLHNPLKIITEEDPSTQRPKKIIHRDTDNREKEECWIYPRELLGQGLLQRNDQVDLLGEAQSCTKSGAPKDVLLNDVANVSSMLLKYLN